MPVFKSPELDLELSKPETFGNVAEFLDRNELQDLGSYVVELVQIDENSMSDWAGKAQGYLDKIDADVNTAASNTSEERGSNETSPPSTALTMSAVIQFTARITGSILSEPDLVRASEPGGEPLASWMSSQLRTVDPDWVTDTDPMTMHMAVTGLAWRKRWAEETDQRFRSTWLPSVKDGKPGVIINANAKSIERVPRITHPIQKYPYEVQRSIDMGHWINYEPNFDDVDPQELQDFYEVDMWLDLDGDGKDEPWTVTVAVEDTPIAVKIVPRWSKRSVIDANDILIFNPTRRYYAYKMIPDPKGNFLPKGFGWLLERIENTADSLLGSIDTTAKTSAQNGGVTSTGGVGLPDSIEIHPNRLTALNTDGKPIADVLSIFPMKQVSPGMLQTLDKIITLGDRLAGTLNMLENAPASMTATLAKGIIDNGSQVQGAVHRRIIGEMTEEMRAFGRLANDLDMLPDGVNVSGPIAVSADPNMATEMQRANTAQIYHEMLQVPMVFNPKEVALRFCQTLRLPNPEKLVQLMTPQGPSQQDQAEIAVKAEKNAIDKLKAKGQVILQVSQAVLALSQAGVNAQNAQLMQVELQKLNSAIMELGSDDVTDTTVNANGNSGSGTGPASAAAPPAATAQPSGNVVPFGQPAGPSNAGPGSGSGQPNPPPASLAA
jgi:hypothetical protein